MKKNDDDNGPTSAADAIASVLADAGIPIPKLLDEIVAAPGHAPAPFAENDRAARLRVLADYGWPVRALEVALRADVKRPAVNAIDRWKPTTSAIVLSGPPGTGKTVAAAWWALGARRVYRFVEAAEMLRVGRFDEGRARWDEWLAAPALCIDDLGAEYADAKGSFVSDLDHLVNRFYANRRELIVTTNCDSKTFAERYGERIVSRITECATWASVGGADQRQRG